MLCYAGIVSRCRHILCLPLCLVSRQAPKTGPRRQADPYHIISCHIIITLGPWPVAESSLSAVRSLVVVCNEGVCAVFTVQYTVRRRQELLDTSSICCCVCADYNTAIVYVVMAAYRCTIAIDREYNFVEQLEGHTGAQEFATMLQALYPVMAAKGNFLFTIRVASTTKTSSQ